MSSVANITSASNIQADYMKLLIAQMRYQDPLEPMNNSEMATQLAQFSQLQQLESMNSSFSEVLATANRTYANSLIGRKISFVDSESQDNQPISATVEQVFNDVEGEIALVAANRVVRLNQIIAVAN
jgi:flagellar hook assembly protein FlgD